MVEKTIIDARGLSLGCEELLGEGKQGNAVVEKSNGLRVGEDVHRFAYSNNDKLALGLAYLRGKTRSVQFKSTDPEYSDFYQNHFLPTLKLLVKKAGVYKSPKTSTRRLAYYINSLSGYKENFRHGGAEEIVRLYLLLSCRKEEPDALCLLYSILDESYHAYDLGPSCTRGIAERIQAVSYLLSVPVEVGYKIDGYYKLFIDGFLNYDQSPSRFLSEVAVLETRVMLKGANRAIDSEDMEKVWPNIQECLDEYVDTLALPWATARFSNVNKVKEDLLAYINMELEDLKYEDYREGVRNLLEDVYKTIVLAYASRSPESASLQDIVVESERAFKHVIDSGNIMLGEEYSALKKVSSALEFKKKALKGESGSETLEKVRRHLQLLNLGDISWPLEYFSGLNSKPIYDLREECFDVDLGRTVFESAVHSVQNPEVLSCFSGKHMPNVTGILEERFSSAKELKLDMVLSFVEAMIEQDIDIAIRDFQWVFEHCGKSNQVHVCVRVLQVVANIFLNANKLDNNLVAALFPKQSQRREVMESKALGHLTYEQVLVVAMASNNESVFRETVSKLQLRDFLCFNKPYPKLLVLLSTPMNGKYGAILAERFMEVSLEDGSGGVRADKRKRTALFYLFAYPIPNSRLYEVLKQYQDKVSLIAAFEEAFCWDRNPPNILARENARVGVSDEVLEAIVAKCPEVMNLPGWRKMLVRWIHNGWAMNFALDCLCRCEDNFVSTPVTAESRQVLARSILRSRNSPLEQLTESEMKYWINKLLSRTLDRSMDAAYAYGDFLNLASKLGSLVHFLYINRIVEIHPEKKNIIHRLFKGLTDKALLEKNLKLLHEGVGYLEFFEEIFDFYDDSEMIETLLFFFIKNKRRFVLSLTLTQRASLYRRVTEAWFFSAENMPLVEKKLWKSIGVKFIVNTVVRSISTSKVNTTVRKRALRLVQSIAIRHVSYYKRLVGVIVFYCYSPQMFESLINRFRLEVNTIRVSSNIYSRSVQSMLEFATTHKFPVGVVDILTELASSGKEKALTVEGVPYLVEHPEYRNLLPRAMGFFSGEEICGVSGGVLQSPLASMLRYNCNKEWLGIAIEKAGSKFVGWSLKCLQEASSLGVEEPLKTGIDHGLSSGTVEYLLEKDPSMKISVATFSAAVRNKFSPGVVSQLLLKVQGTFTASVYYDTQYWLSITDGPERVRIEEIAGEVKRRMDYMRYFGSLLTLGGSKIGITTDPLEARVIEKQRVVEEGAELWNTDVPEAEQEPEHYLS